jgi:catechol 2,3-dioxygenase-like lactoylglutathione lyase family enzyme
MIRPTKLNYVGIVVRDLKRSLAWYRKHFGFKKLFSVDNGWVIGKGGVGLWIAQAKNPKTARGSNHDQDICVRLIGMQVTAKELARAEAEFPEDKDIVRIEHPRYRSYIVEDPDGHCYELYVETRRRTKRLNGTARSAPSVRRAVGT